MVVAADFEKRVFQRMIIDKPVTVSFNGNEFEGICRDLSANGMAIELSANMVSEGAEIRVSLSAGDKRVPPLEATAKVIRLINTAQNPGNEVAGIEFITVS